MNRSFRLALSLVALCLLATAGLAADTSSLRPPPGAKVAIVVFEDMECPQCAHDAPLVEEAVKTYKIPLVRHDFPLRMHPWAFDAALLARWFESQSKKAGDEFRAAIFKNQPQLTKDNLRAFAERFAAEQKLALPFAVDPNGQLAAKIRADQDLGTRIGLEHTPTIYVVTENTQTEVARPDQQLFQMIDQARRAAGVTTPAATKPAPKAAARRASAKKAGKS